MWSVLLSLAAAQSFSSIGSGVEYAQWTDGTPNRMSALRVNLCHPGLEVRATTSEERGQKTSTWASAVGATAATNGGFFSTGYAPDQGRAMGSGVEWPDSTDTVYRGWIAFGEHQLQHAGSGATASLPSWAEEAVNGDATLVSSGSAVDCGGCGGGRAPRTAIGWDATGSELTLVAVDGRSSSSAGMTIDELAVLMASLGVHGAMNLDGGGSTTMWTSAGGVVNDPSDGSERTVGNHLGFLTPGAGLAHHCPTGWRAEFEGSTFPGGTTISAPAGSVVSGSIQVLNAGTETWDTTSTKLAPLPRDESSALMADDWAAGHRVVTVDASTAPGEVGTFSFSLTVPSTVGSETRWEFSFLQESVAWFGNSWGPEDGTFYLTVVATEPVVDTGQDPVDSPADSPVGTEDSDPGLPQRDPAAEGLPWERERITGCAVFVPWLLGIALLVRRR